MRVVISFSFFFPAKSVLYKVSLRPAREGSFAVTFGRCSCLMASGGFD